MSKMGQELEKRLDENKYEMYEALRELVDIVNNVIECHDKPLGIDSFTLQPAKRVLGKVEK